MKTDFIEAIPVPAFVISPEDNIAGVNAAFRDVFSNVQIGRSYLTVLRQSELVSMIDRVRSGIKGGSVDFIIRGQKEQTFRATGTGLGKSDVLICLQDIHETKAAIEIRQNFVTDLGHELKTPLTSISGILETCETDPDAISHFMPILSREVERMKTLVDDLLTLSRVERNERRVPNQTVTLQTVAEEACVPLATLADKAGIRIVTELPDVPIEFSGDANEIVRAISNLVENSIRYGHRGGVVKVSGGFIQPTALGAEKLVSIEVSDDGPGVEAHHIPRLTERFYRADSHRSRDTGGSGLGLAIVKHIAMHHRGQISFESARGQGLKVILELPVKQT